MGQTPMQGVEDFQTPAWLTQGVTAWGRGEQRGPPGTVPGGLGLGSHVLAISLSWD